MNKKYLIVSIYLAICAAGANAMSCPGDGQSATILTPQDLQDAASCDQTQNRTFLLGANLDLKGFSFTPFDQFDGTFDGQGYTISNLTPIKGGGLFDSISEAAIIKNLTLANANIHSDNPKYGYGTLVNTMGGQSLISNVYIKAGNMTITGDAPQYNGGMVGVQLSGTIQNSTSSIILDLTDGNNALDNGGLVGYQYGGTIKFTFTSALLILGGGTTYANGGMVGFQDKNGLVFSCHSHSIISLGNGSAIGNGVLIGYAKGTIHDTFTDGSIKARQLQLSGNSTSGGIIGNMEGVISDSYSNSTIDNPGNINGGLIGYNASSGSCLNSYWNIENGTQTSGGCTTGGRSPKNMQSASNYIGWDFKTTWAITSNSFPTLLSVP